MAVVAKHLVIVPSKRILQLAKQYANNDFLASYEQEIVTDVALNHTTIEMMRLVAGLNFPNGMEDVKAQVALCVKPLITITPKKGAPGIPDDSASLFALFGFSNETMEVIATNSEEAKKHIELQLHQLESKKGAVDNMFTTFYQLLVYVAKDPKTEIWDFYYAYVYSRNKSVLQWALTMGHKRQRLAALKAESMYALGLEIARKSSGKLITEEQDIETLLEELSDSGAKKNILEKGLEIVGAMGVQKKAAKAI